MATIGGSWLGVKYNSSKFGSGQFLPFNDAEGVLTTGGNITQDDARIAGGFNLVITVMPTVSTFSIEVQNDMVVGNEVSVAQKLMGDPDTAWTMAHINGSVYAGIGTPVGPLEMNAMKSSFTLKLVSAAGFSLQ